jgi:hypothetical protein
MAAFTGKLSDDSGVIAEGLEGQMSKIPGHLLGWSGRIYFPRELAGRIRAGNTYRLDVDGDVSIKIIMATMQAGSGLSEYSCTFESMGKPLN